MASERSQSRAGSETVRAVERAAAILVSFVEGPPVQDMAALQKATGLSRPTLYRLLGTLERVGFIYSFGEPRRFQVGHRCAALAGAWSQSPLLASVSREVLEELRRETQETVSLMVPLSDTQRLCVVELKSFQAISFSRGIGYSEPMHRGASGKVILACYAPERLRATLVALDVKPTPALLDDLATIRRRRLCTTHGEVIVGTVAIAAPVLIDDGGVAASVCVFGTELRMGLGAVRRCETAVQAAAEAIGKRLREVTSAKSSAGQSLADA